MGSNTQTTRGEVELASSGIGTLFKSVTLTTPVEQELISETAGAAELFILVSLNISNGLRGTWRVTIDGVQIASGRTGPLGASNVRYSFVNSDFYQVPATKTVKVFHKSEAWVPSGSSVEAYLDVRKI